MNMSNYLTWVEATYSTPEGQAFMLGIGLGLFVQTMRWGFRLLKKGGSMWM